MIFLRSNQTILIDYLLNKYESVMYLKIYVNESNELKNMYLNAVVNHNNKLMNNSDYIDAGFDIFAPSNSETHNAPIDCYYPLSKIDFQIKCSAKMCTLLNENGLVKEFNTGYYMYPRSSLSKTKLRLANATGIIDAGYRGNLIGMFDVIQHTNNINTNFNYPDYVIQPYDRLLQICAPNLCPIVVEVVDSVSDLGDETERGNNGIGSSGR